MNDDDVRPDILDRLRADWCRYVSPLFAEAANEIERLRMFKKAAEAYELGDMSMGDRILDRARGNPLRNYPD